MPLAKLVEKRNSAVMDEMLWYFLFRFMFNMIMLPIRLLVFAGILAIKLIYKALLTLGHGASHFISDAYEEQHKNRHRKEYIQELRQKYGENYTGVIDESNEDVPLTAEDLKQLQYDRSIRDAFPEAVLVATKSFVRPISKEEVQSTATRRNTSFLQALEDCIYEYEEMFNTKCDPYRQLDTETIQQYRERMAKLDKDIPEKRKRDAAYAECEAEAKNAVESILSQLQIQSS